MSKPVRRKAAATKSKTSARTRTKPRAERILLVGASRAARKQRAHALADKFGGHFLAVDLSRVVSEYIGETEKNLRVLFEFASQTNCVLLFDEADALFGKRTNVKDSHDRYANQEVSYLVQRLEQHRGPVLLTTNKRANFDEAFLRRQRFVAKSARTR